MTYQDKSTILIEEIRYVLRELDLPFIVEGRYEGSYYQMQKEGFYRTISLAANHWYWMIEIFECNRWKDAPFAADTLAQCIRPLLRNVLEEESRSTTVIRRFRRRKL